MKLKLIRNKQNKNTTLGELYIDGKPFCYTLEDLTRDVKIKNKTAIPEGKYNVVMSYSKRFKKFMPLIYNHIDKAIRKEGMTFKGVRFHGGNTHKDTEGCILVAANIDYHNFLIWGSMSDELNKLLTNKKNVELIITNKF